MTEHGGDDGDDALLGRLIDASHDLHPDAIQTVTARLAADAGLAGLRLFLVDHDQFLLIPLDEGDPLDIDSTIAGRAYRTVRIVESEPDDSNRGLLRLWVPLLDGAERVGVLCVDVDHVDDAVRRRCRRLAGLVAELIVSKEAYGDGLEQRRRRREMDLAAELRWALLPPLTYTGPHVAVSGVLQPAYKVAGDAFDYALNGDVVHVAIIDAMGHGLEASRIANLAISAYRNARRGGMDLVGMLGTIDRVVAEQFGEERFVTGQLSVLDLPSGRLDWVNAGHPRPLLLRHTTVVGELQAESCLPMGLGDVPAGVSVSHLEPGDRVLFYTDGAVEATNAAGEQFGRDRLADHLERVAASGEPLAEMLRRLSHDVLTHQGTHLNDDATLVIVEWRGGGVEGRDDGAAPA